MIHGDGFFVVSRATSRLYTRAGAFNFDDERHPGDPDRQPGPGLRPRRRRRRRPAAWSTSPSTLPAVTPAGARRRRAEVVQDRHATARSRGIFADGVQRDIAQIAIADFTNPMGLEKVGETSFRESANSGAAELGVSGEGGRGTMRGRRARDVERRPRGRVHQPDPRPARLPGQLARDHHLGPGARGARQHQALIHSSPSADAPARAPCSERASRSGIARGLDRRRHSTRTPSGQVAAARRWNVERPRTAARSNSTKDGAPDDHAHPSLGLRVRPELRPDRAHRRDAGHGHHPGRRHEVRRRRVARRRRHRVRAHRGEVIALSAAVAATPRPCAPSRSPRPARARPRTSPRRRTARTSTRREALMDPATLIGVGRRLRRHRRRQHARGRQPDEPAPAAAAAARLRHHAADRHGRRHAWPTPSAPCAALKRAFTGKVRAGRRRGARPSSRWPRRPAARACWPWRTRSQDIDDPFLVKGVHAGHRRHRPRGGARHPRGPRSRQARRGQAGREVLRRRGRLRPDDRHHRHRHGPGPRAGEPRRAGGARPPDRRRVRRDPVGRHVRQRACGCRSAAGSSGSASSRSPGWSSSIEGVAAIQSGSNPRVVAPAAALAAARRPAAERGGGLSERPRSRRTQARGDEEHENHERWLVTYADMVTLLMVLFIVMFAMSQVDQTQVRRRSRPASRPASARLLVGARRARTRCSRSRARPRSARSPRHRRQTTEPRHRRPARRGRTADGRAPARGAARGRRRGRGQPARRRSRRSCSQALRGHGPRRTTSGPRSTTAAWSSAWSRGTSSSQPTWPSCSPRGQRGRRHRSAPVLQDAPRHAADRRPHQPGAR